MKPLPAYGALSLIATALIWAAATTSVWADTSHCGIINSNQTWQGVGTVHTVTCHVTIDSGVTLTVAEGSIVKFASGTGLVVNGALSVAGTALNPVYLTSISDDTVGGDTNGDGASFPQAGDWFGLQFQESSNDSSLIDHAVIRYAGCCANGAVNLDNASPTIQNTVLTSNKYQAILADVDSFPTLMNNTYTNNAVNGQAIEGGITNRSVTWDMTDTAYYIQGEVSVGGGTTLTINPGVVVKFESNRNSGIVVMGGLRVLGTADNQVYFTSSADDTVQGDTLGDGASFPQAGDWLGFIFQDSSNDGASVIDHAVIRYAGCCGNGGVRLDNASPTIRNTTIRDNGDYGIYAENAQPILGCNDIVSNSQYGIYNFTTSNTIRATNQWWGSDSGPYQVTTNPDGSGNAVTNGVDFSPWRTVSCFSAIPGVTHRVFLPLSMK